MFPDTFTLDGAAAVSGGDTVAVLDTLTTLVDHHLIEPAGRGAGTARFTLLETLRVFALAELDAHGEREQAGDAHADWCVSVVERTVSDLTTSAEADALATLDLEASGLRAAVAWSLARGRPDRALRIMGAGWRYWRGRGRSREGLALLDAAIALADDAPTIAPRGLLADALHAAGELADDCSELTRAVELFERAASIHAELGDHASHAEAQNGQAQILRELGMLDLAEELHLAAAGVFRRLGMRRSEASALNGLGGIASRRGDHAQAAAHWEHAYDIVAALGDRRSQGLVAGNIGIAKFQAGDLDGAIAAQDRALAAADELGDPTLASIALLNRAEVQVRAGRLDDATEGLDRAAELAEQIGFEYAHIIVPHHRALIADARGEIGTATRFHLDSFGRSIACGRPLEAVECVEQLGMLASEVGSVALARQCAAITRAARTASGSAPTEGAHVLADEAGVSPIDDWQSALAALAPELERFAFLNAHVTRASPACDDEGGAVLARCGLSAREAEVARLVVTGRTDREIANELFIGLRTVASHVSAILRKLEVGSRREVGPRLAELGADLADGRA